MRQIPRQLEAKLEAGRRLGDPPSERVFPGHDIERRIPFDRGEAPAVEGEEIGGARPVRVKPSDPAFERPNGAAASVVIAWRMAR